MKYREEQHFNPLIIALVFIPEILMLILVLTGREKIAITPLAIGLAVSVAVALVFKALKLETVIDETGISYRFAPFQPLKTYPWTGIRKAKLREYSPLMEYGGWGYRFAFGAGTAVNMSGHNGLQLEFNSGRKLLIGTRKPMELASFLSNLQSEYHLDQIVS
ncbi:hypothetical protein [Hufsiella ginkgonis]|uniref:Bacterial Pleckstrin homology domain-containing protein n=1 Tax=Hufsiella ginkgonis TaxID=2695274 RepID=A0A7K1XXC5_9SPHI|nr:hypothetical protein [Hufsiella ginkgonis]MXV15665.1 hypothetical protein [Hufsiella ginkgonis]